MTDANSPREYRIRSTRYRLLPILLLQMLFLLAAVWQSRSGLNADAVSYIRIAEYYASGQTRLMVSGYWGPLMSWLMAPLLVAGVAPLTAAWTVMWLSAVLFLAGCMTFLSRLRLPPSGQLLGSALAAIASIGWCTERISPDLLLTGFLMLATAQLVSSDWVLSGRRQAISGAFWALAYFSKAVAFPLAILFTTGFALTRVVARSTGFAPAARALAVTLAVFLVCASPWLTALSMKFHYPTFSVAQTVNHGGVGPGVPIGNVRMTTFEMFHTPEAGRLSSWEDPTSLPYPEWSRFGSMDNIVHQLKIVSANLDFQLATLRRFDVLGFGLFGLLAGALLIWPACFGSITTEPWQWSFAAVAAVLLIYLPGYGAQTRYFYPTYPFLLAAAIGLASWVSTKLPMPANATRRVLFALVAASFLPGILPGSLSATFGVQHAEQEAVTQARELAQKLRTINVVGPIAGEAPLGFFLSYFLGQPYHGNKPKATLAEYADLRGQVRLLLVGYENPAVDELRHDSGFRELTQEVYPVSSSNWSGVAIFETLAP